MDQITLVSVVLLGGIAVCIALGLPVAVSMALPSTAAIILLLGWEGASLTAAQRLFAAMRGGTLAPPQVTPYPLAQAARAQDDMENRRTQGSVVLLP